MTVFIVLFAVWLMFYLNEILSEAHSEAAEQKTAEVIELGRAAPELQHGCAHHRRRANARKA